MGLLTPTQLARRNAPAGLAAPQTPLPAAPAAPATTMFQSFGPMLGYNPNQGGADLESLQRMQADLQKKQGQAGQVGSAIGSAAFGPLGGLVGGVLGGLVGGFGGKSKVREAGFASGIGLDPSNPFSQVLGHYMTGGAGGYAPTTKVLGGGGKTIANPAALGATSYEDALNRYNQYATAYGHPGAQGFGPMYGGGSPMLPGLQQQQPFAMAGGSFFPPAAPAASYTGLGWGTSPRANPFAALAAKLRTVG